jgi:nickel-dependent lactate racemase
MMRPLADALERAPPPRGATTAVCVPDGTRPVDVSAALAALRPHLGGRVTVVIGLGLHRRMTADELPRGPWPIVQHDPDDCVDTGEVDGIPGGVARRVADAEVVLGLGIVELHQYAGFSGGH